MPPAHPSGDTLVVLELRPLEHAADEAASAGVAWLSATEAGRLARIGAPLRRRQYLAGHWLARCLAAGRHGGEPAAWQFGNDEAGRPRLVLPGRSAVSASVSHSRDWIAVALAATPVGIDLEFPRRARRLSALAAFAFSPEENAHLAMLAEDAHSEAFHALWTLKEARGKRGGEGLQPSQARRVTARACAASEAEALHWPLAGQGSLALAAWPGLQVEGRGFDAESAPTYWRYVADDD